MFGITMTAIAVTIASAATFLLGYGIIRFGARRGWEWSDATGVMSRGDFVPRYLLVIVGEYLAFALFNVAQDEAAPILVAMSFLLLLAVAVRELSLGMRRLRHAGYEGIYFLYIALAGILLRLFFPFTWSTWLIFILALMFPPAERD